MQMENSCFGMIAIAMLKFLIRIVKIKNRSPR